MSPQLFGRLIARGGIVSYPAQDLREEVAFLSMQVHWTLDEILSLEHRDRNQWIDQINRLTT
ncbi:DUF6760 family protein [Leptolyngbya sp. AN02str]|uniref:DUF6760 family protein n=1 Tax=Leptolyngbya sp. AN02str TaxID=3423363 RepID=UPI003D31D078